ncbi:hypothetical protein CC78DRAFT_620735 [Lojkania enalia]|uniref:Uncharacterized protein n=1 Tax=Lojkania enalia TaxID=147567 RepID=A0A9P4MZR6_9PLEO|nr:hypothetical protein CC78DRAFT_620735 [Didymosphaeria enalia]
MSSWYSWNRFQTDTGLWASHLLLSLIAAIHLENGTSIPVAQVHGSPGCQDFMRKNNTSASTEAGTFCRLLPQALDRLPPAITSNIDICRNADATHTKALLVTLKAATESYLRTNICYAALSLHVLEHKVNVAHEALGPRPPPAFDEKPWTILAIDYSVHWFNVGLYAVGEHGIVDPVEGYVRGPRVDEDNQLDALRDTLGHLFAHPPAEIRLPEELRHLIVYSGDAKNHEFRRILAEALLNVQLPTQHTRDLLRDANVSSSVFDGPVYTAYTAHVHMDTVNSKMNAPSAFGCKWRTKLYSEDRTEL